MAIQKDVKNRVIELKKAGLPVVAIAKELGICRPTVKKILIESASNKEDLDKYIEELKEILQHTEDETLRAIIICTLINVDKL
ncbi:helix-turn-helix domain-containing protein [Clostridium butyricum]|uniref:helix-turn-helix domain-containing protein n=1 Tax=Clostridium butyricum TaxID=1492 RepID=UPI00290FEC51|nr:helix-turn-helix domain-containing protein [Clostridium butyricum]MDU4659189.1 helix-turn-helix domain-containing protein [Clostridium butyricum]